ncbi:MAG: hypothetical protein NUW01_19315 [Gemmatimonadaceae bacterium]|nr:hypothetical protein [Gemmatimonadaceae bacterium]
MPFARLAGAARDRAGIAMATALGGLVIIGVLIAGVFFTSNQELRVGTNTFVQERAFRAAEFGLNTTLASWSNASLLQLPIGGTTQTVYDSSAKGWRDTVTITRLNATTFLIGSTGTAFGGIQGSARRRTALLVRSSVPKFDWPGALTVRGDSKAGGSSLITGFDANPPGWTSCPPSADTLAGIAFDGALTMVGCPGNTCLAGAPPALTTADAADTATYFEYGDENWSTVTKYASKIYDPGEKATSVGPKLNPDGSCDYAWKHNWGGPAGGACENHFPIIYAKGPTSTLSLTSGSGQGILFVEGNLELAGNFSFNGPIVVRGTISSKGTNVVNGALAAANLSGGTNSVLGTALITYSSCAVNKALETAIPPKRIVERAWMEVF